MNKWPGEYANVYGGTLCLTCEVGNKIGKEKIKGMQPFMSGKRFYMQTDLMIINFKELNNNNKNKQS